MLADGLYEVDVVLVCLIPSAFDAEGELAERVEAADHPAADLPAEAHLDVRRSEEEAARVHNVRSHFAQQVPNEREVEQDRYDVGTSEESHEADDEQGYEEDCGDNYRLGGPLGSQ